MTQDESSNSTAVRIYGDSDASEDFPVLKAFQQYIDAEQAKARRRIVWLSVVFGFVTISLVALFLFIISILSSKYENRLIKFSQRNQELNDKLVEFAMKEREKPVVDNSANQATMNIMKDAMTQQRTQINDLQNLLTAEQKRSSELIVAHAQSQAQLNAEKVRYEREKQESEDKIKRATALLVAEKEKIKQEREKLKKQEIELHKQRLYPEYYKKKQSQEQSPEQDESKEVENIAPKKLLPKASQLNQSPSPKKLNDGAVRYFDTYEEDSPAKKPSSPTPPPSINNGAIRYFQTETSSSQQKSNDKDVQDLLWVIPE